MNILFITGNFPNQKSGIGDSAYFLFDNFSKYEKSILLTSDDKEIMNFIESKNYKEVQFIKSWSLSYKNIKQLYHIINKYKIDTIHIEYPGKGYGKGLFACFIPIIVKMRCKNILVNLRLHEYTKARLLRRVVILPLALFSDKIFIPAINDYKKVKSIFGKKVKKTNIGSNIVPVKNNVKKVDKSITLGYFGFVYHNKGIENLLKILKLCIEKNNNIKLKIIGEIDSKSNSNYAEYHKKIEDEIKLLKLENNIEITGYLSDEKVSREIQSIDIAVLPFDDGLSLRRGSFLAFLDHGIPIITTDGDEECKEIFNSQKDVYMATSIEEIVETILVWSNDKEELKRRSIENRMLGKKFNWSEIAINTLEEYRKGKKND